MRVYQGAMMLKGYKAYLGSAPPVKGVMTVFNKVAFFSLAQ